MSEFFNFILPLYKNKINIGIIGRDFFTLQIAVKVELDQYAKKIKYNNYDLFFISTKNDLVINEKKLNQKIKLILYLIEMILNTK